MIEHEWHNILLYTDLCSPIESYSNYCEVSFEDNGIVLYAYYETEDKIRQTLMITGIGIESMNIKILLNLIFIFKQIMTED